MVFNLFIVFLISGLWHGASWNFVIWGSIHGVLIITYLSIHRFKVFSWLKFNFLGKNILSGVFTFGLVSAAWVFFRATAFKTAYQIVWRIVKEVPSYFHYSNFQQLAGNLGMRNSELYLTLGLIFFLELVQYINNRQSLYVRFNQQPIFVRWFGYALLLFSIAVLGVFENKQFIYFQF